MKQKLIISLGQSLRWLAQKRGGSGSALPGLIIEKLSPNFASDILKMLPNGVVIISGTNGKTTTTKIVCELLESQGLKVFTNRTGSNFSRGVSAAILGSINNVGQLDADIAVLELDEAHGVHFVKKVRPTHCLILNVMRDQLDRFGEIDYTADLLKKIASSTTTSVVINQNDPRLNNPRFVESIAADISYFGASEQLLKLFPSDDDMRTSNSKITTSSASITKSKTTILKKIDPQSNSACINFDGVDHDVNLQLKGVYNLLNATAAVALVRQIVGPKLDSSKMFRTLEKVTPAFGRGESITINSQPVEIILVKNPSGFRLSLTSFANSNYATMIAINDNYADGRDMSWLWDVDFDSLRTNGVSMVSGVRAYDMALRLQYDLVSFQQIIPEISSAVDEFIAKNDDKPKRIFCSYTAMLAIRKSLKQYTDVEQVS